MTQRKIDDSVFFQFLRKLAESKVFAYGLAVAAVISGVATVAMMTGQLSQDYGIETVVALLYVDVILLLMLGAVIIRRLVKLWRERKSGAAGAGLHGRLVALFTLVAVAPAIIVAVFSALFLNFGVQAWFSERVSTILHQSSVVTTAYLNEHKKSIQTDALAIANDLELNLPRLIANPRDITGILTQHANVRSLSMAVVMNGAKKVVAGSRFSPTENLDGIPEDVIVEAQNGAVPVIETPNNERVRALKKLDQFVDSYLVVERYSDPRVIGHINRVERAFNEYRALEKKQSGFQISFVMIFVIVAVLLLFAAAWVGLTVSNQMADPLSRLISAADDISSGNLAVRVDAGEAGDEISSLGRAFNNMAGQLESQREGLVEANRELDERRRFTETVLTGVSAGVIGLDADGRIHLPNRSASELLGTDLMGSIGRQLGDVIPEMADLFRDATSAGNRMRQADLRVVRRDEIRTLHVRIAAERLAKETIGYVVTFDDVTELLSAQRKAAWADVARRIAHEIKNPLTPIQLSAERLKRKYRKQIDTDPETFETCTDTIVRQVEGIGRMVDEFSAFARMPEPKMQTENLSEICRQTIFLEQNRNPEIEFSTDLPQSDVKLICDSRQISRALGNLLKNASESIISAENEGIREGGKGRIVLSVDTESGKEDGVTRVLVEDNGKGLPQENRSSLTEPYVTTREKGTGLGLAIVKKIAEDHNGSIRLEDRPGGGARIELALGPVEAAASSDARDGDGDTVDPLKTEIEIAARGSRA